MSRITDIAKTMKTWWDEDDNPLVHLALNEIIRIDQEQLPTIEPKRGKADRPQGEWIYGEHDVAMCDGYRCNRCDFFVPWDYEHKFIDFINDYHFCPNCGADMRGKDDE